VLMFISQKIPVLINYTKKNKFENKLSQAMLKITQTTTAFS